VSFPQPDPAARVPIGGLAVYCLPATGMGFMLLLQGVYFLKYATDVLAIAPATIGMLLGLSRIWDAVSDPVAGFLTDRTETRWGRRRPWMLAGALPMGLAFMMMWSPPAALAGPALITWMGGAIVLFYTALTAVDVPHSALGAELTTDYHERTRVFGAKRIAINLGSLLAGGSIAALSGSDDPRATGFVVAASAAVIGVALTSFAAVRLRERSENQGRGAENPWRAFRDILANPHARLLLAVFLTQQLGIVALTGSLPFLSEYVLGTPHLTFVYILILMGCSLAGVPLWLRLAPYYDKKNLLIASMLVVGLVIGLLVFATEGDVAYVCAIAAVGGFASAGADILAPSIQADIIDYDELETGERKEGAYFATWAFAAKTAGGISTMAIGFALSAMGFVPNAVQTPEVQQGLRLLAAIFPAALYALGVVIFLRFTLTRTEHARIRRLLEART
jgi:GPH family glycoside/pentoside/hexuronide:cation symporter